MWTQCVDLLLCPNANRCTGETGSKVVERYKIEVRFEQCPDGRLRVWSPDVPGFRLSHHDKEAVLADIAPALETILADRLGGVFRVLPLHPLAERQSGLSTPDLLPTREYVTEPVAA